MNSIHNPEPDHPQAHPEPAKTQKINGTSTSSPTLNPSIFAPGLVQLELVILVVYPLTVLLGIISNHPPESYFAKKSNLINLFFLKFGWAWTTIAFIPHLSRLPQKVAPSVRYAAATIWWYLVTQWCFGPPIMDKVYPVLMTGIEGRRCFEERGGSVKLRGTRIIPISSLQPCVDRAAALGAEVMIWYLYLYPRGF
jgi:hypothetical protein